MNTNRSNCVPFTPAACESLSAVALATPSSREDFLSACERAGMLGLIWEKHSLRVWRKEDLEEWFSEYLDEAFGPVLIAGRYEVPQAEVLYNVDEIAYREMFREYADSSFVECDYCYFRKDDLDDLDQMDIIDTLAEHCVERFELSDEQAEELGNADTPMAFVAALKRLCLEDVALSASVVVSQDEKRRM